MGLPINDGRDGIVLDPSNYEIAERGGVFASIRPRSERSGPGSIATSREPVDARQCAVCARPRARKWEQPASAKLGF